MTTIRVTLAALALSALGTANPTSAQTAPAPEPPAPALDLASSASGRPATSCSPDSGWFEYAAKFVCGDLTAGNPAQPVAVGNYLTAINVHNPSSCTTATLRQKVTVPALTFNQPAAKTVSPFSVWTLGPDETLALTCRQLRTQLPSLPVLFEGFVVIQSPIELDVVAVITAGPAAGAVQSLHTERVPARRFRPCGDLKLDLSTGPGTWTFVSGPLGTPGGTAQVTYQSPERTSVSFSATGKTGEATTTPYVYQRCFCLCQGFKAASNDFSFRFDADDKATVRLNGNVIGEDVDSDTSQWSSNPNAAMFLKAGENCLEVQVVDSVGGFSNFWLTGSLSAAGGACNSCSP